MNKSEAAQNEWNKVLEWALGEHEKVTQRLSKEGKLVGLDTNRGEYAYISEKVNQRLREIKEKYA